MRRIIRQIKEKVQFSKIDSNKIEMQVDSWREFQKLGYFMTKDDLQRNYPFGLLQVKPSQLYQYHETFGTTGKPSSNPMCRSDFRSYVKQISYGPLKFKKSDMVLIRYPYSISTPAHLFHKLAQEHGSCVIPSSSRSVVVPHRRVIGFLKDLDVTIFCSLPTEAIRLAAVCRFMGLNPQRDFPHLRAICTAGELLPPAMKKWIEIEWGVEVYNFFGSTEAGNIAYSDSMGKMRFPESHFNLSIIDIVNNRELLLGELGHLVVTTRKKKAMPLLKYLTEDYGSLFRDKDGLYLNIYGRKDDKQLLNGHIIYFYDIKNKLFSLALEFGISPFWRWYYGENIAKLEIEGTETQRGIITKVFPSNLEIQFVQEGTIEKVGLLSEFGQSFNINSEVEEREYLEFFAEFTQVKKPKYFYEYES